MHFVPSPCEEKPLLLTRVFQLDSNPDYTGVDKDTEIQTLLELALHSSHDENAYYPL